MIRTTEIMFCFFRTGLQESYWTMSTMSQSSASWSLQWDHDWGLTMSPALFCCHSAWFWSDFLSVLLFDAARLLSVWIIDDLLKIPVDGRRVFTASCRSSSFDRLKEEISCDINGCSDVWRADQRANVCGLRAQDETPPTHNRSVSSFLSCQTSDGQKTHHLIISSLSDVDQF